MLDELFWRNDKDAALSPKGHEFKSQKQPFRLGDRGKAMYIYPSQTPPGWKPHALGRPLGELSYMLFLSFHKCSFIKVQ